MSVTVTTPATPKSKESSRIGGNTYFLIRQFSEAKFPGWLFSPDSGFRCFRDDPNRVRKPDVAFIALDRMPPATYQDESFCSTVPDRIVEVISPNDLHDDVEEKL